MRPWLLPILALGCTTYVEQPAAVADSGPTVPSSGTPCEAGAHCNPHPMGELPYGALGDTRGSEERHIDRYGCSDSDEGGAEVWYVVELAEAGLLIAVVDDVPGDGVDVDVHILTDVTPESCVARDNVAASAWVGPGPVHVVVDTWRDETGAEYPGPYVLSVDLSVDDPRDSGEDTGSAGDTGGPGTGACPSDMVAIEDYCVDRYEGHLEGLDPYLVPTGGVAASALGVVPQGYISGEVAELACAAAGKRLCTSDEWLRACEGPSGTVYPYGDSYVAGACNEGRSTHPVVELFGSDATWSGTQMNDPRLNQLADSLAPSGAFAACVTDEGVHDLHGNLHEWVADGSGIFRGGFYVDASINGTGCSYRTTAHSFDYHDYSTGFRCCVDAE